ncbi:MAG: MarR family winged helix-turn-helix transcriptional regulator [Candidatus Acidiferrales bacterium]
MAEKHMAGNRAAPKLDLEQHVFLELLRVADSLVQDAEAVLKPYGLSHTQYNALRILRGAGPTGLACGGIGERMLTHDPDITRLLDRLESRGFIKREREQEDRRVVKTRITDAGLRLLEELDVPVSDLHQKQLGHLDSAQLQELKNLLSLMRTQNCPTKG